MDKAYYVYVAPGHIKYFDDDDIINAKDYAEYYKVKVKNCRDDEVLFDFSEED